MDALGRRYRTPPSYWLGRSVKELNFDAACAAAGEIAGIATYPETVRVLLGKPKGRRGPR